MPLTSLRLPSPAYVISRALAEQRNDISRGDAADREAAAESGATAPGFAATVFATSPFNAQGIIDALQDNGWRLVPARKATHRRAGFDDRGSNRHRPRPGGGHDPVDAVLDDPVPVAPLVT